MESQIYIIIAVAVLLLVLGLIVFKWKTGCRSKLTPLTSLAFVFILTGGILFDDRLISYSLIGIGVLISIVDAIRKKKDGKC